MTRIVVLALVLAAACGKGGGKSVRQGMEILCVSDEEAGVENLAPADRQAAKSKWIEARLTNRDVRAAFARIGNLPPAERVQLVTTLVAKAKLDGCAGLAPAGGVVLPPGLTLPELSAPAAAGTVPLDDAALITAVATKDAVVLEGSSVVSLHGMLPDAAELEGGAMGLQIPRLSAMTEAFVAEANARSKPLAGARLLVHAEAPYRLLLQLVVSMKKAGLRHFEIVALRGDTLVAVPITLPDAMPASVSADQLGAPPPLGMIVAMTKSNLLVFSISGTEGSIQAPKLSTGGISSAEIARVQTALIEIHARHTDERRIVVMADPTINMQLVTELLAAVRATPDGGLLFVDVTLSAGFE